MNCKSQLFALPFHKKCMVSTIFSKIPDQGNKAELTLTCLHRNTLGIDEFLGQATLPLKDMDVYDRPRAKWFKLESKPGKEKKHKERGELEVRIAFVVKSGSLTDLSKKDKHKSSIGLLASSVGGSLLSIGQGEKRKSIKKLAGSLSSKLHIRSKKKNVDGDDSGSFSGSFASIGTPTSSSGLGGIGGGSERRHGQRAGEADPGVISEDEDEFVFDNLSHKSSGSSLNIHRSGLQVPPTIKTTNFAPRYPSPLLSNGNTAVKGKQNGGKPKFQETFDKDPFIAEMEQLELDFSVRTRTLPPPLKPPRTQSIQREIKVEGEAEKPIENFELNTVSERPVKLNEWESKLYGGENYLEIGSTDSLKRRSFGSRVRLPISNTESVLPPSSSAVSSSLQFDSDGIEEQPPKSLTPPLPSVSFEKSNTSGNLRLSSDVEPLYVDSSHASPVMFEQRNSTAFFMDDALQQLRPQLRVTDKEQMTVETDILIPGACEDAYNFPDKDSKLETHLCVNEHKIQEDEEASPEIQIKCEGRRSSDANRLKKYQKHENFVDFSVCMDKESNLKSVNHAILKDNDTENNVTHTNSNFLTPEQSPNEFSSIVSRDCGHSERCEKRFGKFKYSNKRGEVLYQNK